MSENITMSPETEQQVKLTDIVISNENIALNVIVSFLNVAQKRGAFSFDESAKIWECIQAFVKNTTATEPASEPLATIPEHEETIIDDFAAPVHDL